MDDPGVFAHFDFPQAMISRSGFREKQERYKRYIIANETILADLHRKNKNVKVRMLGVRGDSSNGADGSNSNNSNDDDPAHFDCAYLQASIARLGFPNIFGKITDVQCLDWIQVEYEDLEEELEWTEKKSNRYIIICSCISRIGDDDT